MTDSAKNKLTITIVGIAVVIAAVVAAFYAHNHNSGVPVGETNAGAEVTEPQPTFEHIDDGGETCLL